MALGLCRGAGIKDPRSLEKAVVTLGWSAQESVISKMRLGEAVYVKSKGQERAKQ